MGKFPQALLDIYTFRQHFINSKKTWSVIIVLKMLPARKSILQQMIHFIYNLFSVNCLLCIAFVLVIWYFAVNYFNNNGTFPIFLGSSCSMMVTGQNWLARRFMAMKGRWDSMTPNISFRSLESTLITSLSLCLSPMRGALSKWGSLVDFHLTSTRHIMEVHYASLAVDRMDLPLPPLGLTGLCCPTSPHKVRNISLAKNYVFMWGKCQLNSNFLGKNECTNY